MSASSLWVTWGIITQLRARLGAEMRWMRDRATRSTSPNFSKSIDGQGSRSSSPPPLTGAAARRRVAGRPGGAPAVGHRLHVVLGDPPLAPAALSARQADAELAGQAAGRGAGVDRPAAVARSVATASRPMAQRPGSQPTMARAPLEPPAIPRAPSSARLARSAAAACSASSPAPASPSEGSIVISGLPCDDAVADRHADLPDHAAEGRRHVHRRLVGFERDQRVLGGHRVPDGDEDLDDGDGVEVADVGNLDLR